MKNLCIHVLVVQLLLYIGCATPSSVPEDNTPKTRGLAPAPPVPAGPPANAFFYEDFTSVAEGTTPSTWSASDELVVSREGRNRLLKLSGASSSGSAVLSNLQFPVDFRLELVIGIKNMCWVSPAASEGTSSSGINGTQGPRRWSEGGSSPWPSCR